jgi:hypothetical protein
MTDTILVDKVLSDVVCKHEINARLEQIDIATWLSTMNEDEFRRCCPPDHISCGRTSRDDGTKILLHIETIGHALMIQRYVMDVATPELCKMISLTDALTPNGLTRVGVVWTLSVKRIDDRRCEFSNSMVVHPTAEFMEFIAQHRIRFNDAVGARQHVEGEHNRRETPLMAASIERFALNHAQKGSRSISAA